jgi:SAM-dependent methyltransferase
MKIPRQENIRRVAHDDPLPYYYRAGWGWAFRRRLELGLELLGTDRSERLLEVGYGSGICMPELSRRTSSLVGVDVHPHGAWVRDMMDKEGARSFLASGSILRLPFKDGTFDKVFCLSVLEHVLPTSHAVFELARVLRPNGVLVAGIPRTGGFMNLLIRLTGHQDIEHDHVGDTRTILSELARVLQVEETVTFPFWLSPANALYTVCRATKR